MPVIRAAVGKSSPQQWFFPMPRRVLLVGMGDAQDRFLAERPAKKLQADGQFG
jgi:hypothetical protein